MIESNSEKILVVGDLHLGYEGALNETGILVTRKMFEEMISDLEKVFSRVGKVDKVVLLGDVKHVFGTVIKQEWEDVLSLFSFLEEKCEEIIIVKGNHDNILEPIVKKNGKVRLKDYFIMGSIVFLHGHRGFEEIWDDKVKTWIIGHVHPAVNLTDGVKVEKYKCFLQGRWKGKEVIIVPSFAEHSGGSDPRFEGMSLAWAFNLKKFDVKVVSDLEVLNFGKLEKLG